MDRAAYAGMNAIEGRHWWFVARRAIIDTLIRRTIKPRFGARVLEAGCGTGGNLALLSRFGRLSAFEFDAEARGLANAKQICRVVPGALPDGLDAADAPYDLVALMDVLEHIDDDVRSLRALGALLSDDGSILLTVPAVPLLWSHHDVLHHHKRRYSRRSLAHGRHEHPLLRLRPPANHRGGRIRRPPIGNELLRDMRQIRNAHEENQRIHARRQLIPAHVRVALRRVLMPGDDRKGSCDGPVRDRNTRISRHRNSRGNAWNDFKGQTVFLQQQCFLSAAAEHERIAALEAHHALALLCLVHEQLIDIRLFHGMPA